MDKVIERFLKYVKYNTKSDENSNECPSTPGQKVFAKALAGELRRIGLQDVCLDETGYVMATLPANIKEEVPVIGFIAHMDTSPEMPGENVSPKIIENYDGKDIVLNEQKNIVLSPADFPELKNYIGETLITTDGTTLLGADDKAGVAEIVTACEYLKQHSEIKHGAVRIGFTPDEEIGRGANRFDVKKFAADFAYTVDGGKIGDIEYENFNAAGAKITIHGRNVHPGTAKGKMINSILIGTELANSFPPGETPAGTEGYDGFYHLTDFKGSVEETTLHYIIRDFDMKKFEKRKEFIRKLVERLNEKYGNNIDLDLKDQYYNMKQKIEERMDIVDLACRAMETAGIKPNIVPIRGGTDGSKLSYMGLPTPNIFTGGHNFHGRYEYIPAFTMKKAVEVIINIVKK